MQLTALPFPSRIHPAMRQRLAQVWWNSKSIPPYAERKTDYAENSRFSANGSA